MTGVLLKVESYNKHELVAKRVSTTKSELFNLNILNDVGSK